MSQKRLWRVVAAFSVVIFLLAAVVCAEQFVGSKKSNKYHYSSCPAAQKIKPGNLMTFSTAKYARAKGYYPCKICAPPTN
jgi:hypothetical protein